MESFFIYVFKHLLQFEIKMKTSNNFTYFPIINLHPHKKDVLNEEMDKNPRIIIL